MGGSGAGIACGSTGGILGVYHVLAFMVVLLGVAASRRHAVTPGAGTAAPPATPLACCAGRCWGVLGRATDARSPQQWRRVLDLLHSPPRTSLKSLKSNLRTTLPRSWMGAGARASGGRRGCRAVPGCPLSCGRREACGSGARRGAGGSGGGVRARGGAPAAAGPEGGAQRLPRKPCPAAGSGGGQRLDCLKPRNPSSPLAKA